MAQYWLNQPHTTLTTSLVHELGLRIPESAGTGAAVDRSGLTIIRRANRGDLDVSPRFGGEFPSYGEAGLPPMTHWTDRSGPLARPLIRVRYRPTVTGENARTVHLAPLPDGGRPVADSSQPSEPAHQRWDPQLGPVAAGVLYRSWGWPVTLRRDQVWLTLTGAAVALLVPTALAAQVAPILALRRCPPLMLVHPATPDHRVLLGGEPYPVPLGWPAGVHRVSTNVLLPPTPTPRGPLTWTHPPEPNSLRLTREIDILAALRTALDLPPSDAPSAF